MTAVMPDGRKLLRLEVRNARRRSRRSRLDQDQAAHRTGVHRAQGPGPARGTAHGVRGSGLPQHLRVLGGPRGDLPHRRRPVHATLRLLPDRHRQARGLDVDEPRRVAESVQAMGLRYATVTGVARDDLADGGAWLYAETVRQIHALNPGTGVELLIPDFNATPACSTRSSRRARGAGAQHRDRAAHLQADPPRLPLRPLAGRDPAGACGRSGDEVQPHPRHGRGARRGHRRDADLRDAGCDLFTITQYLRPSVRHHPVSRWVRPEEFVELSQEAESLGFVGVLSGPLVRSSYRGGPVVRAGDRGARGHPRLMRDRVGSRVLDTPACCAVGNQTSIRDPQRPPRILRAWLARSGSRGCGRSASPIA